MKTARRARPLSSAAAAAPPHSSQYYLDLEDKYGSHNYHPLPVVLSKGEGQSTAQWKRRPSSRPRCAGAALHRGVVG